MRSEIQRLIDDFKRAGWKSKPHDFTYALIVNHPEYLPTLLEMALDQLPKSGTFFDDAISYIPESEFPRLAKLAIDVLARHGPRETIDGFLEHASFQRVQCLHPFLTEIFESRANWQTRTTSYPWRESGRLHFDYLRKIIEDRSDPELAKEAWYRLAETRDPINLKYCLNHSEILDESKVEFDFLEIGFVPADGSFTQLYGDDVWHLEFPSSYWMQETKPSPVPKLHPTWHLPERDGRRSGRFGGVGTHACAACGNPGHRLFDLPSNLRPSLISGQVPIQFEVCLSCLGWEVPDLFYRHEESGELFPLGYQGKHVTPEYRSEPFIETEVSFLPTPARWRWQDWGTSNARQSLHRLGGHPSWVQTSQYPTCPLCSCIMPFLFQLDSDLLVSRDGVSEGFLWGSGGICYAHWCDRCKVSGFYWQCT